jgi:hypothetical protein
MRVLPRAATAFVLIGLLVTSANSQNRPGGRAATSPSYRTLTGKVAEIKSRDGMLTVDVGAATGKAAKKAGQAWVLSVGRQTLLMRAGRNGQFSPTELTDVKTRDMVQAVASLEADPTDRSHVTWWLVVYPEGTTPPTR